MFLKYFINRSQQALFIAKILKRSAQGRPLHAGGPATGRKPAGVSGTPASPVSPGCGSAQRPASHREPGKASRGPVGPRRRRLSGRKSCSEHESPAGVEDASSQEVGSETLGATNPGPNPGESAERAARPAEPFALTQIRQLA